MTAKNVKIITIDGEVTLRGPVHTELERDIILQYASGAAGTGHVDNELEIEHR